jgi:hypothetical protein
VKETNTVHHKGKNDGVYVYFAYIMTSFFSHSSATTAVTNTQGTPSPIWLSGSFIVIEALSS